MTRRIATPVELNRIAKLLMDAGDANSVEHAEQILAGYSARIHCANGALSSSAAQAALLTMVVTGRRALPGGLHVDGDLDVPWKGIELGYRTVREAVTGLGGKISDQPTENLPLIVIGDVEPPSSVAPIAIRCRFAGWRGGVAPCDEALNLAPGPDLSIAGALSGAIAIGEVFQHLRGGFAQAGRRVVGQSLWEPDRISDWMVQSVDEPMLQYLPSDLWMIGLGHLGQAYLWILGLLPYANRSEARFVLQDFDTLDVSNESTSVLTDRSMRGRKKTRAMASWAEAIGFRIDLNERRFGENMTVRELDPVLALCGVDNPNARAALESAGFGWIIDAGLGAGIIEFLAMRLYTFPGPRKAKAIWGGEIRARELPLEMPAYQALKEAGIDECGLTLLAERTVGAPFVGVIAAVQVIAEVLRGLHGGRPLLALDATLRSFEGRLVVMGEPGLRPNPGFCAATEPAL